jgi:hypothetical protein
VKRRQLLQGVVAILWGRPRATAAAITRPPSPSSRLSAVEMRTLLAYGDLLVEGRALSASERGYLTEHIEDSARRSEDMRERYKRAARLLDRLAGRRFWALGLEGRRALVTRHRLDSRPVSGEDRAPSDEEILAVRTRVIPDLIEGYWSSPAGWAAIGYTTFPGRCGDLDRYTRPEA